MGDQQAEPFAFAPSGAKADEERAAIAAGFQILGLKDIRLRDTFDGMKENFEGWAFPFETDIDELGWKFLIDKILQENAEITADRLNGIPETVSRNLYLWLTQRMKGKALTLTKLTPRGNGFEALRKIYAEYRPKSEIVDHGLLTAIIQPKWWKVTPHNARPFMDVVCDWEDLIAKYELQSGEKVSNGTRCATVIGFAPVRVVTLLSASAREVRTDYKKMMRVIEDAQLTVTDETYVPNFSSPMDVGAVLNGTLGTLSSSASSVAGSFSAEVGAIGFDAPCSVCKKMGHDASRCWWVGKGGGKGQKGNKDKNKSKSVNKGGKDKKKERLCHYCKKAGHYKAECHKFVSDKEKGVVSTVLEDSDTDNEIDDEN